jgi:hypothetical protein
VAAELLDDGPRVEEEEVLSLAHRRLGAHLLPREVEEPRDLDRLGSEPRDPAERARGRTHERRRGEPDPGEERGEHEEPTIAAAPCGELPGGGAGISRSHVRASSFIRSPIR